MVIWQAVEEASSIKTLMERKNSSAPRHFWDFGFSVQFTRHNLSKNPRGENNKWMGTMEGKKSRIHITRTNSYCFNSESSFFYREEKEKARERYELEDWRKKFTFPEKPISRVGSYMLAL